MNKLKRYLTKGKIELFIYTLLCGWLTVGIINEDIATILGVIAIILFNILNAILDIHNKMTELDLTIENLSIKKVSIIEKIEDKL